MKLLTGILTLIISTVVLHAQEPGEKVLQTQYSKLKSEFVITNSQKVVRNAPFSAEAVSESVQVLADGNKLTRHQTTRIYRDSQGRFRREQIPNLGSSIGSVIGLQQTISIFDPIAGIRLLLDPSAKTARRTVVTISNFEGKTTINTQQRTAPINRSQKEIEVITYQKQVNIKPNSIITAETSKTESLGVKEIEGVKAEGTRATTTVPAGAVGNEQAFDIVYERWYSEELQEIVLSKHTDPRFGVQTYRLVNIKRNEPDRNLFIPPTDYTITDNKTQTYQVTRKP